MLSLLGSHLARSPTTISDKHRLYWNSFRVPGGPPQKHTPIFTAYHKKVRKVPNIFKDQATKDQYKADMQKWFHPHPCPARLGLTLESSSTYLQQVSPQRLALEASNGNIRSGSPTVMAGPHSCSQTKPTTTSCSKSRDTSLDNMATPNGAPHTCFPIYGLIHSPGRKPFTEPSVETKTRKPSADISPPSPHGPTYYRNLTTAPTKEFIANEISKVRSRNQTRRTQDKTNNLTEYRQMLSATFEKKQYSQIIKRLTGEFPPPPWTHTTYRAQTEST